jgi:CRP/FNR family transcriptional regulator, cyclic AMP receptor protein
MRCTAGQASLSLVSDAQFLHTLTPAESDALEDMGEPGTFAAGTVIFEQGGKPDCVLLVRGGRVRIAARGAGGDEILLAERGPGELLGDLSGIDGQPRSASVIALDDVRGLIVPLHAFRGFLMDHPRAAISLLELISRRLREAEARQIPG